MSAQNEWIDLCAIKSCDDMVSGEAQKWIRSVRSADTVLILNESEFLVLFEPFKSSVVMFKYNTYRDEWTPFLTLSGWSEYVQCKGSCPMALDTDGNRLYLYYSTQNTTEYRTEVINVEEGLVFPLEAPRSTFCSKLINVNGEIHRISSYHHCIWNEMEQIWKPIKADSFTPAFVDELDGGPQGFNLVHVPTKKIILMIGGRGSWKTASFVFWKYSTESQEWKPVHEKNFELCKHLEKEIPGHLNKEFFGSSIRDSLQGCEAVLSADESFLILLPSWRPYNVSSTHLLVLDIRDDDHYFLRRSAISVPHAQDNQQDGEEYKMVTCGGGSDSILLVNGWARRQGFNHKNGEMLIIPPEIAQFVAKCCSMEMVHLIGASFHKRVSLNSILRH